MVKFPYREEGNPPILRPTVDAHLECAPTGEWTTRALIDTGSPLTVFDRGVAEALCVSDGRSAGDREFALVDRVTRSTGHDSRSWRRSKMSLWPADLPSRLSESNR